MTQISQKHELLSLLKTDDKGWNIQLFEDQSKLSMCICTICKSVCCDAVESWVELGGDHDDDDIFLYCNNCLNDLIHKNHSKEPVIVPSRVLRRQIFKSIVFCPYSTAYKSITANNELLNNDNECIWKGTLSELINEHIIECTKTNDPSFEFKSHIKALQNKNKSLNDQIITLHKQLKDQKAQNKKYKKRLKDKQNKIEEQEKELNNIKQQNKDMQIQLNQHHINNDNKHKNGAILSKKDNNTLKYKVNDHQRMQPKAIQNKIKLQQRNSNKGKYKQYMKGNKEGKKEGNNDKQHKNGSVLSKDKVNDHQRIQSKAIENKMPLQKRNSNKKKKGNDDVFMPPPFSRSKITAQKRKVIKPKVIKVKQKKNEKASIWDIDENADSDADSVTYKKRMALSNYKQRKSAITPITEESKRRLRLGIDAPSRTRLKSFFSDSDSSDEDDGDRLTVSFTKAKHNQQKVNSRFATK